jgi:amidohydrolase
MSWPVFAGHNPAELQRPVDPSFRRAFSFYARLVEWPAKTEREALMNWQPDDSIRPLIDELVATRRDLHRHPELGYAETRTSNIIVQRLTELGFEVRKGLGKTGVVGLWRGEDPNGPTVAFRADMDALPIQEENTHGFVSTVPGLMHACGHDGHVAILLGFARWLSTRPQRFPGHVKLLFQPAEEGGGGARPMIAEGALDSPQVSAIFGLHLWNQVPTGYVGVKDGPLMAATDEFRITVKGRGGHGAMPHQTSDAVLAAAQVVQALQTIASRRIDPLESVVVTVGSLHAGKAANVIAERAELKGTARSFLPQIRRMLPGLIEQTARSAAAISDASIEFDWIEEYPPLINPKREAEFVRAVAISELGEEFVLPALPTMGGEDFAYYLEKVPGCYFWLGAGNVEKGIDKPHHNPRFDIDEEALPLGVALFARLAETFFQSSR